MPHNRQLRRPHEAERLHPQEKGLRRRAGRPSRAPPPPFTEANGAPFTSVGPTKDDDA